MRSSFHNSDASVFTLILGFCLVAFWPVFSSQYLTNFDDNIHFLKNLLVTDRDLGRVSAIFFEPNSAANTFIPLTILTFFYENLVFGQHAWISHLINFLLHLGVTYMVLAVARKLGLRPFAAGVAALLFAVHPLHVEPVAWVSSRKDLLYSLFYLLSIYSYLSHINGERGRHYIVAVAAAGLSVLSKPTALSLPLALLLVDYLRGRRFDRTLVLDKIPFCLAVWPIAVITYLMNARQALDPATASPWIVVWCAAFYVQKFFLPLDLSVLYLPNFPATWQRPEYLASVAVIALAFVCVWRFRVQRLVVFAFAWYVASTFFLWRADAFDFQAVADRFMYLPSTGLCLLVGYAADQLRQRLPRKRWIVLLGLAAGTILLVILSNIRARDWDNPYRNWSAVIRHLSRHAYTGKMEAYARNLRALAVIEDESFQASRKEVLSRVPEVALSDEQVKAVRFSLAIADLKRALKAGGPSVQSYNSLSRAHMLLGNHAKAEGWLWASLRLDPGDPGTWQSLAYIKELKGDIEGAVAFYERAASSGPVSPNLFWRRARLYHSLGRSRDALDDAIQCLMLRPGDKDMNAFAVDLALEVNDFKAADILSLNFVRVHPRLRGAHEVRVRVLSRQGDCGALSREFERARSEGIMLGIDEERLGVVCH